MKKYRWRYRIRDSSSGAARSAASNAMMSSLNAFERPVDVRHDATIHAAPTHTTSPITLRGLHQMEAAAAAAATATARRLPDANASAAATIDTTTKTPAEMLATRPT